MEPQSQENKATVFEHISVLRKYLILCFVSFVSLSILANFFYEDITRLIFAPLGGQKTIFLSPLDPIFFIMKIDFSVGFILSLPIIIWCLVKFISPSLSKKTLRIFLSILLSSTALISLAIIYAYYFIAPLMIKFLSGINVPGTEYHVTAQSYLNFFLAQLFISIIIFQIPLIIFLLTYLHLLNPYFISKRRPLIYIIATIAFSILTPTTDLFSLAIVLIPALLSLEFGLLISKVIYNRRKRLSVCEV